MSALHTPGPWTPRGGGHSVASPGGKEDRKDMMDWCSSIDCIAPFTENQHGNYERVQEQVVAKAYGRTLEEAQANACHIALCVNVHDELLAICKEQHRAIDLLLARLIVADHSFMPTQWAGWPLIKDGHAVIAKATGSAA